MELPVTWWQDLLHGLEIHLEIRNQLWRLSEKFDTRGYKNKQANSNNYNNPILNLQTAIGICYGDNLYTSDRCCKDVFTMTQFSGCLHLKRDHVTHYS